VDLDGRIDARELLHGDGEHLAVERRASRYDVEAARRRHERAAQGDRALDVEGDRHAGGARGRPPLRALEDAVEHDGRAGPDGVAVPRRELERIGPRRDDQVDRRVDVLALQERHDVGFDRTGNRSGSISSG
jgi:hypothetical protein